MKSMVSKGVVALLLVSFSSSIAGYTIEFSIERRARQHGELNPKPSGEGLMNLLTKSTKA
jgi:hypothetical protein